MKNKIEIVMRSVCQIVPKNPSNFPHNRIFTLSNFAKNPISHYLQSNFIENPIVHVKYVQKPFIHVVNIIRQCHPHKKFTTHIQIREATIKTSSKFSLSCHKIYIKYCMINLFDILEKISTQKRKISSSD